MNYNVENEKNIDMYIDMYIQVNTASYCMTASPPVGNGEAGSEALHEMPPPHLQSERMVREEGKVK